MKKNRRLIQTISICNQDIGMEFGIETCATQVMKRRKIETTKVIGQPNQESLRIFDEKENC